MMMCPLAYSWCSGDGAGFIGVCLNHPQPFSDGSIFVCAIFSRTLPDASQAVYSKELPGLRVLKHDNP